MITPRPELASLAAVPHGGPDGVEERQCPVRIDASTAINAFGPAACVIEAIRGAPVDSYPDPHALAPREAAALRCGRPLHEIAFGAGCGELLAAAMLAYVRAGDIVLVAEPTYGEYVRAARLVGAGIVRAAAPVGDDATEFVRALKALSPRIAVLCAPNNPTGRAVSRDALTAIANAATALDTLLIVDQSYDAFLGQPLGDPALPGHSNVLHLRSLTKDHAIAGVRCGLAIGPASIIAATESARTPWPASTAAHAATVAALSDAGIAHAFETTRALRAEALWLAAAITALGVTPHATDVHFMLIPVGNGAATRRCMLERSAIRVRDCADFGLADTIRIAARTRPDNIALLQALQLALGFKEYET